jgi:hypothetical protein
MCVDTLHRGDNDGDDDDDDREAGGQADGQ